MANFGPKPWTNPFGIISILGLFQLPFLISQKDEFSLQNIMKHIFLAKIALKRKSEKQGILDKRHGLTPFEKSQYFASDYLNVLFFQPKKGFFFVLEFCKTHFPGQYCIKNKMEKWPIFEQNHGLWKNLSFSIILFLQLRKACFCFRIW